MGNLLGTPITDKETHVGITVDEMTSSSSPDGGGLQFGISSMQGWRVHMEDAHIAQPFLFAERPVVSDVNDDDDDREEEKEEVDGKVRRGIRPVFVIFPPSTRRPRSIVIASLGADNTRFSILEMNRLPVWFVSFSFFERRCYHFLTVGVK